MSARNAATGPVEIFVSGPNELAVDRDELKTQLLGRLETVQAFRDSDAILDLFYSEPVNTAAEMAARLERLTSGIRIFLRFLPLCDEKTDRAALLTPEIAAKFTTDVTGRSQAAVEQAWAQQQFAGIGGALLLYRRNRLPRSHHRSRNPSQHSGRIGHQRRLTTIRNRLCSALPENFPVLFSSRRRDRRSIRTLRPSTG